MYLLVSYAKKTEGPSPAPTSENKVRRSQWGYRLGLIPRWMNVPGRSWRVRSAKEVVSLENPALRRMVDLRGKAVNRARKRNRLEFRLEMSDDTG